MNIFKWLRIPSGEKVEVKAFETWYVRWECLEKEGYSSMAHKKPQAEIFTTEADAEKFAHQLREARTLLRDKANGCEPTVEFNRSPFSS